MAKWHFLNHLFPTINRSPGISEIIDKTAMEPTMPSQDIHNNSSTLNAHLNESTNTLDNSLHTNEFGDPAIEDIPENLN